MASIWAGFDLTIDQFIAKISETRNKVKNDPKKTVEVELRFNRLYEFGGYTAWLRVFNWAKDRSKDTTNQLKQKIVPLQYRSHRQDDIRQVDNKFQHKVSVWRTNRRNRLSDYGIKLDISIETSIKPISLVNPEIRDIKRYQFQLSSSSRLDLSIITRGKSVSYEVELELLSSGQINDFLDYANQVFKVVQNTAYPYTIDQRNLIIHKVNTILLQVNPQKIQSPKAKLGPNELTPNVLKAYFGSRNGISFEQANLQLNINYTPDALAHMSSFAQANEITNEIVKRMPNPFVLVEACSGIGGNTLSFLDSPNISVIYTSEINSNRRDMLKRNIEAYRFETNRVQISDQFTGVPSDLTNCALFIDPPWANEAGDIMLTDIQFDGKSLEQWIDQSQNCRLIALKLPFKYNLIALPGFKYQTIPLTKFDLIICSPPSSENGSKVKKLTLTRQGTSLPKVITNYSELKHNLPTSISMPEFEDVKLNKLLIGQPRDLRLDDMVWGGLLGGSTGYVVSPKADGKRKLLFLDTTGIWLLKEPLDCSLIFISQSPQFLTLVQEWSPLLFDGELIPQSAIKVPINQEYYYVAFDCITFGRSVLYDRIAKCEKFLTHFSRVPDLKQAMIFGVKEIYPITQSADNPAIPATQTFYQAVTQALDKGSILPYRTDGLIFTPMNYPYLPFNTKPVTYRNLTRSVDICKWKPPEKLSIDLYIDISKHKVYSYRHEHGNQEVKLNVDWTKLDETMDQTIYEFGFRFESDNQLQLIPIKVRDDKIQPNGTDVVNEIISLFRQPILETTLRGRSLQLMQRHHQRIMTKLVNTLPIGSDILSLGDPMIDIQATILDLANFDRPDQLAKLTDQKFDVAIVFKSLSHLSSERRQVFWSILDRHLVDNGRLIIFTLDATSVNESISPSFNNQAWLADVIYAGTTPQPGFRPQMKRSMPVTIEMDFLQITWNRFDYKLELNPRSIKSLMEIEQRQNALGLPITIKTENMSRIDIEFDSRIQFPFEFILALENGYSIEAFKLPAFELFLNPIEYLFTRMHSYANLVKGNVGTQLPYQHLLEVQRQGIRALDVEDQDKYGLVLMPTSIQAGGEQPADGDDNILPIDIEGLDDTFRISILNDRDDHPGDSFFHAILKAGNVEYQNERSENIRRSLVDTMRDGLANDLYNPEHPLYVQFKGNQNKLDRLADILRDGSLDNIENETHCADAVVNSFNLGVVVLSVDVGGAIEYNDIYHTVQSPETGMTNAIWLLKFRHPYLHYELISQGETNYLRTLFPSTNRAFYQEVYE
jgi:hypothetical protein